MFFAVELQMSRVNVSSHPHGLFRPSKRFIRGKIALRDEHVVFRCANAPAHRQLGLFHGRSGLEMSCLV